MVCKREKELGNEFSKYRPSKTLRVFAACFLGSLLAFGLTFTIALQAAINIAVVTCSAPTKGIALPLVSAGGSALVATMAGVGLLMNVASHTEAEALPPELGAVRLARKKRGEKGQA